MVASSSRTRIAVVVAILGWLITPPLTGAAVAAPPAKTLVITGTVTEIRQVDTTPASRRRWRVTVAVEEVKAGKYSEPTFSFAIHSPARAGLEVGHRYTIEATRSGREYVVDETRPRKE